MDICEDLDVLPSLSVEQIGAVLEQPTPLRKNRNCGAPRKGLHCRSILNLPSGLLADVALFSTRCLSTIRFVVNDLIGLVFRPTARPQRKSTRTPLHW